MNCGVSIGAAQLFAPWLKISSDLEEKIASAFTGEIFTFFLYSTDDKNCEYLAIIITIIVKLNLQ